MSMDSLPGLLERAAADAANYLETRQDSPSTTSSPEVQFAIKAHDLASALMSALTAAHISSSPSPVEKRPSDSPITLPGKQRSESVVTEESVELRSAPTTPGTSPQEAKRAHLKDLARNFHRLDLEAGTVITAPGSPGTSFRETALSVYRAARAVLHDFDPSLPACTKPMVTCSLPAELPSAVCSVVDDESANLKLAQRTLAKLFGQKTTEVLTETDGHYAIENLLPRYGDRLDALILDNQMPLRKGEEIIHDIRTHPIWSKIVVVLHSGDVKFERVNDEGVPYWKELGFDGSVPKPETIENFRACFYQIYAAYSNSSDVRDERRWIPGSGQKRVDLLTDPSHK